MAVEPAVQALEVARRVSLSWHQRQTAGICAARRTRDGAGTVD
jgi:hypothetical protein